MANFHSSYRLYENRSDEQVGREYGRYELTYTGTEVRREFTERFRRRICDVVAVRQTLVTSGSRNHQDRLRHDGSRKRRSASVVVIVCLCSGVCKGNIIMPKVIFKVIWRFDLF